MTDPTNPTPALDDADQHVQSRAELTAEEREAGSDDPVTQARVILEDSEERVAGRDAAPGSFVERRTSEETVEPVE
jgi:hypothetical protein